ncbi:MAG TPA: tetratricopeptide repeat protein [Steroidobacteraceae bacterium]|nr:tetratricopeptide repeat protein [Steroidobacteraceae bacterium]
MTRVISGLMLIALVLFLSPAHAKEYGHYDPKKIFTFARSDSGQNSVTVNFLYLDQVINDLGSHAGSYPPRFDSPDDLNRARTDAKALSGLLDSVTKNPSPNQHLLLRVAVLNSIAHNLDVPGTAERAVAAFTALLRQSPDDPVLNFRYGEFLCEAGKPGDAIPVLEKASSLGVANADYFLGIAYLATGDKGKALNSLERYAKHAPNDPSAAKMIDAIRNGRVTGVTVTDRPTDVKDCTAVGPVQAKRDGDPLDTENTIRSEALRLNANVILRASVWTGTAYRCSDR